MQTLAGYLPRLIKADGTFVLPAGDGRTAWVDTRDIASVAATVLTQHGHDGAIYPVTGPEALSMRDLAGILSTVLGRPITYQDASPEQARRSMQQQNLQGMADFLTEHYQAVKRGGFEQVSDTVKRVGGSEARTFATFATENKNIWLTS